MSATRFIRQIVLVSGPPGSGKTTLAVPLAAELGFPLLSKDDIKETLWDTLSSPSEDLAWSRDVGGAAMEVLWAVAARCPFAVVEAPFRPGNALQRSRLAGLDAQFVEVHCSCRPVVAMRRYSARAGGRHAAHVLQELTPAHLSEFEGAMGMGPVIEVDTEHLVDVHGVASQVRELLREPMPDRETDAR